MAEKNNKDIGTIWNEYLEHSRKIDTDNKEIYVWLSKNSEDIQILKQLILELEQKELLQDNMYLIKIKEKIEDIQKNHLEVKERRAKKIHREKDIEKNVKILNEYFKMIFSLDFLKGFHISDKDLFSILFLCLIGMNSISIIMDMF